MRITVSCQEGLELSGEGHTVSVVIMYVAALYQDLPPLCLNTGT